jgi:predicted site-specific integrase-resolvase
MTVWLTPAQVSDRIGFKQSTLANWRSQGKGPAYITVGTRVRYDEVAVANWQENQSHSA